MDKKREKEKCYNCKHFNYRELKRSTKFFCERNASALVGANWCKSYQPAKEIEQ